MATEETKDERDEQAEIESADALDPSSIEPTEGSSAEVHGASQLGTAKYVHAAFFVVGILAAFIGSKVLGAGWTRLTEWPAAVHAVPQLIAYSEEQRETYTMVGGAVLGAASVIQAYRNEGVRRWADEVAAELAKVTWPNREAVMNGTLVVIVASAITTVYIAILDRFWSFLTTLVYKA
ncbi:MAG TPA: preprotein translocase subunit SecE [Polyangiaceae bacterium]|jgi:preprotein translocase subunit SecE